MRRSSARRRGARGAHAWLGAVTGAVLTLAAGACGLAGTGGSPAGASGVQRDRALIGDFGEVMGMASSRRLIFVASSSGLAVYDRMSQRWLPPLTVADGYPADRVTALAGDPDVEGVWIGALGEVLFYQPAIDQLIRTVTGTRVDRIVFDRADPAAGAYVGSFASGVPMADPGARGAAGGLGGAGIAGDGWVRVNHSGFASRVQPAEVPPPERWVVAPTLESISQRMPSLASFSDLLTRDDAMRSWRPTSATQVEGMSEVWLGTRGGGVYIADPLFNRARSIPFGLFEPGVSALALASDGVWAASLGADPRGTGGVTFATSDLQQWRWVRGPPDGSLAGIPVYDILVRDGGLWIATDRGVAHRTLRDGVEGVRDWRWVSGGRRAFALAVIGGDVWAGTDDGLMLVGPADASGPPAESRNPAAGSMVGAGSVRALLAVGDSLLVGSASGLTVMRLGPGAPRLVRHPGAGAVVWLQAPVVALVRTDSLALVATRDRAGSIDLRTGTVGTLPGNPDLSRVGRITSLAADARTLWVGGDRGAIVIDRASGLARSAGRPGFGDEPVFDIALEPDHAWFATSAGLVRVRRMPDGGVR